jgi:hypothetical protein
MTLDPKVLPSPEEAIALYNVKGDTENAATLFYCAAGGLTIGVIPEIGPGQMQGVLRSALPQIHEEAGDPDWILFCSEAYLKTVESEEATREFRPGELQEAALAGDQTIQEVVMVSGFSKEREYMAAQRFSRVGGEVVWGELEVMDHNKGQAKEAGSVGGGIPDIFRPLFT